MLFHYRSYFSRITRERRTTGNNIQATSYASQALDDEEEDERAQEDEDNQDFDTAITSAEANTLLAEAIRTLDNMLTNHPSQ